MTKAGADRGPLRRAIPWVAGALAVQVLLRIGGRLAARRLDSGDETSPDVRRVRTFDQVKLAPTDTAPSRVHLDLMFAGADLDLTHASPQPGGADAVIHCLFGGGNIRVPPGWRVSWDQRGIGGVGVNRGAAIEKSPDPSDADLRIHLRALFGGVGLTT